ncbi:hypothetical protein FJY90_06995 [Candidatus Gottesmanbacteria bacterium]|nr:hypothetical protein [Candidatus Gottesmanbacteria bacterium]
MDATNTANNNPADAQLPKSTTTPSINTSSTAKSVPSISKEQEMAYAPLETVQAVLHEIEIPEEVEKAGVKSIGETIELPPDVKKLGVAPAGISTTLPSTTTLPQIVLPLSDQNVFIGLHAKVTSALRWLAIWCIRKLKKAHITLKLIHGKIIRIKTP